jgi:putative copper export protein/methionine-rich copper-binding protein CopC
MGKIHAAGRVYGSRSLGGSASRMTRPGDNARCVAYVGYMTRSAMKLLPAKACRLPAAAAVCCLPGGAAVRCLLAALVLAALAGHTPAHAHVRLEAATPGAGDELAAPPATLRLLFSGFIERRYTSVTLSAPDGERVGTGAVVFVAGSDREFTVSLPPLTVPGVYTVAWRTAGADGHVLEGSYSFALLSDDDPSDPWAVDSAAPQAVQAHDHGAAADEAETHEHVTHSSGGVLDVTGRLLHFSALLLLIGALSFRVLLLPRIMPQLLAASGLAVTMRRRVWLAMTAGAVLLGAAAVLRLWLQSAALHGAERAWRSSLLSMMLTDTSWGRAWVLQAFLFAMLGAAIAWARPHGDRTALWVGIPAVIGLAMIPGLTGHAAADAGFLVVMNDTVHVLAIGAWIGMLFMLAVVGLPTLLQRGAAPASDAALAVHRFSPIALTAAAIAVTTGVLNALIHIGAPAQLVQTDYGRMLLIKIGLVALVFLAGFMNWRVLRPRLGTLDAARRLRISAGAELGLAALVLLATAVLTGLPRP